MPGLGGILRKPKKEEKEAEAKGASGKIYLKAMPLRELSDLDTVKNEVKAGYILILRVTPLASKSIEDVKQAVNELSAFAETIGGDIARLGEERIVICPQNVRIWREKAPVVNEPLPTAA
ncbi:MAG: cell division protein SepF [Candidatus Bathyarchaeota archaeon]|nr:cell division protein SepF [Candidatus Bathyarchaeota archaeon]